MNVRGCIEICNTTTICNHRLCNKCMLTLKNMSINKNCPLQCPICRNELIENYKSEIKTSYIDNKQINYTVNYI